MPQWTKIYTRDRWRVLVDPLETFCLFIFCNFEFSYFKRPKTHKQHKSYTRDALMDKNLHPRWIRGFSRPYRNFLLFHILQFRIFILRRAKTHKQHKSYTQDALFDKNSHPRWIRGVSVDLLETFCLFTFFNFEF